MNDPSLNLPEPPEELAILSRRLCTRIVNAIERNGPLPFARYMDMALYEPGLGYYVNGLHKFGAAGDFVTAPEHGEVFGHAIAAQIDELGESIGDAWTLLELGPGSGRLVHTLLQAMHRPPARVLLLEPSAALRAVQQETLATLPEPLARRIEWIDAPPDEPFDGVVLANEVLDALPVERFRIGPDRIERQAVTRSDDRLTWTAIDPGVRLEQAVDHVRTTLPVALSEGYVSELCVDLGSWLETVTTPLARGLVLLIDYGYPRHEFYHPDRSEGTLVCHYRHRAHFDPLVWPGLTDISAFVDFTAVAEAAQGCGLDIAGFTTQAGFLASGGALEAIEAIADPRERLVRTGEFKRLVLPGEMGEKFKVMALTRSIETHLSAFELADHVARL